MKKILTGILVFVLIPSLAFSMTRNSRKIPQTVVVQSGGETLKSIRKTLGVSGVTTQITATSTPCISASICASPQAKDIILVGNSDVVASNSFSYSDSSTRDVGYIIGTGTSVDRCATFNIDNVNQLYAAGRASSDSVTVTYVEI